MKKLGKIVLTCATVGTMAFSIVYGPYLLAQTELPYEPTQAEVAYNTEFETTLKSIYDANDVTFVNRDFFQLVSKSDTALTVEDLKAIRELQIDLSTFSSFDLSDLKYLPNLERLTISNGTVNCSDLMYNQKLTKFTLKDCDFSNTLSLPNSIDKMNIENSKATDSIINVPYYTKEVFIDNSVSNKINVKNPANLETFSYNGYGFLDIADLKDCTNLKFLYLTQCPNVYHPECLINFKKLTNAYIDEFCCVWGTPDCFPDLPNKYRKLMAKLNKIADSLYLPDYTDEEKIEHLTLFVTSQIEYDFSAIDDEDLLTAYNTEPLNYALNGQTGVCVGYATLFKALANRMGLDSYQPDNINHTWNMVKTASSAEYRAYDMTKLDNRPIAIGTFGNVILDEDQKIPYYINYGHADELLFYDFDCNEAIAHEQNYQTNVENITVPEYDTTIGYVNINAPTNTQKNFDTRLKIAASETGILLIISIIKGMILSYRKPKKKKKVLYRNNFNKNC